MCSAAGETLNAAWLTLLKHSRFHGTLCGLVASAAVLLRLLNISSDLRPLADPLALRRDTQEVLGLLGQSGLHFPATFMDAVAGDGPL